LEAGDGRTDRQTDGRGATLNTAAQEGPHNKKINDNTHSRLV